MQDEMGLSVRRSRFLWRGYTYPLHFVCFEDPKKLGYFNCQNFQLGLNKKLMFLAKDEVIKNILRHELAHFYSFLLHGKKFIELQDHGAEYQKVCRGFHWGPEVSAAYSTLEEDNREALPDAEFEKIKSKITKLLALSSSENAHEAEMATIKANEYLIKYNLKNLSLDREGEDDLGETVVSTVISAKRMNATLNGLYDILQYFHVQPVLNRSGTGVGLDVVGSRLNVEVADYVCKFLDGEFQRLWKLAQKNKGLKGLKKKNSYIFGLSKGLSSKLASERHNLQKSGHSKELISLKDQLERRVAMAFPRLSRQQGSQAALDANAVTQGHKDGRNIQLRPGVSQGNRGLRIGYNT